MARKVISKLSILVGAVTDTLRKDLNKAGRQVKGFASKARGAGGGLSAMDKARASAGRGLASFTGRLKSVAIGLTAMVAATAAATLGVQGLRSAFADIDRISKFADETGISTEQLAGFRLGAGLTGTSISTLEKGLQKFVRRLGEAKEGMGEGLKGFRKLNLNVEELVAKNPAEAFKDTAEAIRKLPTPAEKAAAAYAIFGRQGQELLTFLVSGRAGIERFITTAEEMGITFGRDMGAKVEAANDAIEKLKTALMGASFVLAIDLAPAVKAAAEGIIKLVKAVRGVDASTVKAVLQIGAFVTGFKLFLGVVPKVITAIKGIVAMVRTLTTAEILAQSATGVGLLKVAAGLAVGGAAAFGVSQAFDRLTASSNEAATAAQNLVDTTSEIEEVTPEIDATADAADRAREAMEKWQAIGDRITDRFKTPLEKMRDSVAEAREALDRGVISWDTYSRAISAAADEYDRATDSARAFTGSAAGPVSVGAVSRGTAAAGTAIAKGRAAFDEMNRRLREMKASAERREKIAEEIAHATRDVEKAVKESAPSVVEHRI